MNIEQEIIQFRLDLKSYSYHRAKINEINEELLILDHKMKGLSSIRYDKLHNENTDIYHDKKLEYIVLEEKLIQEKEMHEMLVKRMDAYLDTLEEDEKELLTDIYVKCKSYNFVALKRHASKDKIKLDIRKYIKKCLNN